MYPPPLQHRLQHARQSLFPAMFAATGIALIVADSHAGDYEHGTVIVTASRQEQRTNELLSDVTVIRRDEIEHAGQSSLEQLLARQPGMDFYSNGGPGSTSGLFIRGASPRQSIVLIDGVRFGSASSGDAALSRIPLAHIDRIEILRGPASSLYGADAIGGIVQIFTRQGTGAIRPSASFGVGTARTTEGSLGVFGGSNTFSFSLQGGYSNTAGFSALRNPANSAYNADRDDYRSRSFSGSASFMPAPGQEFGVTALHSGGVSKYDSFPQNANHANQQDVGSYSVYSRNRLGPLWTSMLRLGRSTDDMTNLMDGRATDVYRTDQTQLSWQNDFRLPVGQALLAAEHLKQELSSSTTFLTNERTIRSLLGGWSGHIDSHRLQLNLRHDTNSQFGGRTTGLAAYGYQLTPDWRAHLSYGTAFRAPTFNELYYPDTGYGGGNPRLKPELARNREAGVDWEVAGHRLSVVYFDNEVTNLINGWPPVNVNKASVKGSTISYAGVLADWRFGAAADLHRARDDVTGKRLARRTEQQLKSHLSRSLGQWTFGGEWQVAGARYDDAANLKRMGGYGIVNLFGDYRLEHDWSLFVRANNVFDKNYELARDYATPRASVFAGIRYTPR